MSDSALSSASRRTGRRRDRRGRGPRGPLSLPGPLNKGGPPAATTRAQRFDEIVRSVVDRLDLRWHAEMSGVEFGVEDTPQLTEDWADDPVPLAALGRGTDGQRARIVVFRRPVELRASGRTEITALVYEILVEQLADLLGREPDEIDPR